MGIPYIYKIKSKLTGKYYVGIQYGIKSNPLNFWKTYFTSNKYVLKNIDEFYVIYVKPKSDAIEYEKKFLSRIHSYYGKNKFCELMINRNLAPGIVLDDCERQKISQRMKIKWKNGEMSEAHKKSTATRKNRKYNKIEKSIEERLRISERMKKNNPMFNDGIKRKHAESMNSIESKKKKSETSKGNTYVKGKSWYNDGIKSKMLFECPDGWNKGRLNPHWNHKRNGKKI